MGRQNMSATHSANRKVCILLNRKAGTARGTDADQLAKQIAAPFQDRGDDVVTRVCAPSEMGRAVSQIAEDRTIDLIVLCGGDGTLSRCAHDLRDHPAAFGFVPLGTLNLFARSLNMPADPEEAARIIAAGTPRKIDTGRIDGRLFLHHVSFGLHPKILRLRSRFAHSSRLGKVMASCRAFILAVRQPPHLDLKMALDGQNMICRSPALVFSNNPFGSGHLPYPDDPASGQLGVYMLEGRNWRTAARAGADAMLGRLDDNPEIRSFTGRSAEIFPNGKRPPAIRGSIDGELERIPLPVKIEIKAASLEVVAPEQDIEA